MDNISRTLRYGTPRATPEQRDMLVRRIKLCDRIEKHDPQEGLFDAYVLVFDEDTDEPERLGIIAHPWNPIAEILFDAWAKQTEEGT